MSRILAISSYVAHGAVGLQAALPGLQRRNAHITALPTILLSNHPGYARYAGTAVATDQLQAMLDAIDANGWLSGIDGVLTGYMPSAEHAIWARSAIDRITARSPDAVVMIDPVLGDDPGGLYVDAATAHAIRDHLLPAASVITPNRFELEWLSGERVIDPESAIAAARCMGIARVAATSIPAEARSSSSPDLIAPNLISNVLVTVEAAWVSTVPKQTAVPHGTGDLFAGLLLSKLTDKTPERDALAYATHGVARAIAASHGQTDLAVSGLDFEQADRPETEVIAWPS
jgi:pyridoxine kinase